MTAKSEKILRAFIAVFLCVCAVALATWTVLTEKADVNLVLNSGKTNAVARVTQFDTYSNGVVQSSFQNYVSEYGGTFGSYGTATFRNNILSLNRLRVDDRVDFVLDFTDKSSVKTQYRVVFECTNDYYGLYEGLTITVRSSVIGQKVYECSYEDENPANVATDWVTLPQNKDSDSITVSVKLPPDSSDYSGYGTQISVAIQVVPLMS